ncbi:hypothetical protein [Deinococcus aestuarii]|nr:hypothetical protein [Deinococcus aestuarii]
MWRLRAASARIGQASSTSLGITTVRGTCASSYSRAAQPRE